MLRIRKVKHEMFIVEKENYKWTLFGLKKEWKPYITVSGIDEVWHHSTYEYAIMNLVDQVKKEVRYTFNKEITK